MERLGPESLEGFVSEMEMRDDAGGVPFGGGLLIAAPEGRARDLVRLLGEGGISASVVVDGAGVRVTA